MSKQKTEPMRNDGNYTKDGNNGERLLPPRGDYQTLLSFQKAEVVYDITFHFAHKFLSEREIALSIK